MTETAHARPGVSGHGDFAWLLQGTEDWKPAHRLGLQVTNVYGDPTKPGIYVTRIKWPAHVMSLPHSHPGDRHVTVLSGTWFMGIDDTFDPAISRAAKPGSYTFQPAGAIHWDGTKEEEAVIQITGYGPTDDFP
ncbi:cupin domain-containing protein [Paenarthrobacter sp. NPDC058040]|uniref:cupin domain-containing protein n=1 Tax=unclassified Paenarthrobacter TaxID=2634190 RepID=UPI0036D86EFF